MALHLVVHGAPVSRFPTTPEALTDEWLSTVLNADIRSHEVEYFSEGTGVMAWVSRIRLESGPGEPDSVIAKFPSPAEANRVVARQYDMYGREVRFYQDIAPNLSLRVPRCYHVEYEPADEQFVLLLEDIGHLRIGDQVAGCSEAEAAMVVRAIADLHASGWEPAHLELRSHNHPTQVEGMSAGFGVGWPVIQEKFPELVTDAARASAELMPGVVGTLLSQLCQDPVALIHADVRLDNVFFDDADDSVVLVDWQAVCTSAPEQDLAYFVTQSLSTPVRQARDWVAYYHDCLSAHGIDYSLELCRERYRLAALYLLCYAVIIAGTLDLSNERGQALGRTLTANTFASLTELDAFGLLEHIAGKA